MATRIITQPAARRATKFSIRHINDEDLKIALRQGLDDFNDLRGDLFFAGLIYTLIGVAAVVDDHQHAAAAVLLPGGRRRRAARPGCRSRFLRARQAARDGTGGRTGSTSSTSASARRSTTWAWSPALLLVIFFFWLLAAGALYAVLFGWTAPQSIPNFLAMVFTTPRGWALIGLGAVVGAIFGWVVLALSVVSLPMLVDRDVSASEAVSASWRAAHANKSEMIRWGLDRHRLAGARITPAVRRPRIRPAVARLFDLAPLHAPDRSRSLGRDQRGATISCSRRKPRIEFQRCASIFGVPERCVSPGYSIISNGTFSCCSLAISSELFSKKTLSSDMPWTISNGSEIRLESASASDFA